MKYDNLVLVGFMGTGKSTVGQLLAVRLGWTFVDTDVWIEQAQGVTIQELFKLHGEPYFRNLETETLAKALDGRERIIATGGGIVLAEVNRRMMLEWSFVVALTAQQATIIERVENNTDRPLLHGDLKERVATLMEQRKDAYTFADCTLPTDGMDADELALKIELRLREARQAKLIDGRD